jgi:hypothetical protein
MDAFSDARPVTSGPNHHFFGYYDKCPWDTSGRYLLALEVAFIDRPPTPEDQVTIGMVDLHEDNRWLPLAQTRAWNWQQGTMLRWLSAGPDQMIIYNTEHDGRYASVVQDVHTGETRTLPMPIYAVSNNGRSAVTLNFSRVHRTRPGYGYASVPDTSADDPHPEQDGIYNLDLETGEHRLIISLAQIAVFQPDETMNGCHHWFNHLQFNTDDSRFLFLHRWQVGTGRRTRLFTANPDGSDIFCVSDHEMTSHFDWKDPHHILAWARRHDIGDRYFLFKDRSDQIATIGEGILTADGHCSYSPDRKWILTDTYPQRDTPTRTLLLYHPDDERRVDIGSFYSPPEITGEIRCDLHPRWNRNGTQVCVDSVHEGERQMYVIDVEKNLQEAQ